MIMAEYAKLAPGDVAVQKENGLHQCRPVLSAAEAAEIAGVVSTQKNDGQHCPSSLTVAKAAENEIRLQSRITEAEAAEKPGDVTTQRDGLLQSRPVLSAAETDVVSQKGGPLNKGPVLSTLARPNIEEPMTMTLNRNKMEHLQQGLDAATSKAAIDHLYIDNRNWILKLPPLERDAVIEGVCDARDDAPE